MPPHQVVRSKEQALETRGMGRGWGEGREARGEVDMLKIAGQLLMPHKPRDGEMSTLLGQNTLWLADPTPARCFYKDTFVGARNIKINGSTDLFCGTRN